MAAFTVIDHTEIGSGGAASWAEASIASSYDHLLIKMSTRTETGYVTDILDLQVGNSGLDTGSNYSATSLYAYSTTPASVRATGADGINVIPTSGSNATADTFAVATVWIPNYANTANYKQILIQAAKENASTGTAEWELRMIAGLWSATSAITDVGIHVNGGQDIAEFSTFTLYGVTGA